MMTILVYNVKDEDGRDFFNKKFLVSEEAGKTEFTEAIAEGVQPGERVALYEAGESTWGEMLCSRLLYAVDPDYYGDSEVHTNEAEAEEEEEVLLENEPFDWEDEDEEFDPDEDEFDWEDNDEFDPDDEPILI